MNSSSCQGIRLFLPAEMTAIGAVQQFADIASAAKQSPGSLALVLGDRRGRFRALAMFGNWMSPTWVPLPDPARAGMTAYLMCVTKSGSVTARRDRPLNSFPPSSKAAPTAIRPTPSRRWNLCSIGA